MSAPDDLVCTECGGSNISILKWVNVNTHKIDADGPNPDDWFCLDCDKQPVEVVEQANYKKISEA